MEATHEQARRLSSGTIATLTGLVQYEQINRVRNMFSDFVESMQMTNQSWVQAWEIFSEYAYNDWEETLDMAGY